MKKLLIISLLLITVVQLQAQNKSEKNTLGKRPDLKGDLILSFGLNVLNRNTVKELDMRVGGSNSFSFGYMYPIEIGNTNFTFNGGISLSYDKYAFSKDSARTLVYTPGNPEENISSSVDIVGIDIENGFVRNSKFEANYINLPLEFRYYFNKGSKSKGLFIAAGGSIGYLITGKTKVKFTQDEETKKIKRKENFELNQFRYGAHVRVGIGGFGAFFKYDYSELFNPGKGPQNAAAVPATFGLSFDLF